MNAEKGSGRVVSCVLAGVLLLMMACSLGSGGKADAAPTETPTPTAIVAVNPETPAPPSRCAGLSGYFELQLLVGPADAVGLEPHAVGNIPFSVVTDAEPYVIEGGNTISYSDQLVEEWGTYTVSFNMAITLGGVCSGESLTVDVEMSGDQLVEVRSEGFSGDYPWSGTHENTLTFPLQEGATAGGEGWQMVLHLD